MKSVVILCIAAVPALAGCASSVAPSDAFNDWTQPTAHYMDSEQRSASASKPSAVTSIARASTPQSVHP